MVAGGPAEIMYGGGSEAALIVGGGAVLMCGGAWGSRRACDTYGGGGGSPDGGGGRLRCWCMVTRGMRCLCMAVVTADGLSPVDSDDDTGVSWFVLTWLGYMSV